MKSLNFCISHLRRKLVTINEALCILGPFCGTFRQPSVTKNRCVTHVKIRGYANLVSSLLAYLISAVASWFSNSILGRSRMLLQIAWYCNITLFSTAGKF